MTTVPTPVPTPPPLTPTAAGYPGTATPATPAAPTATRRRRGGRAWLGALPLLVFFAIGFGLPAVAIAIGAFTTSSDAPGGGGHFTMANLSDSLQGAYLTALLGSVKLSALTALIGTAIGLPLAQAVATSRFKFVRETVLAAPACSPTSAVCRWRSCSSPPSATPVRSPPRWA